MAIITVVVVGIATGAWALGLAGRRFGVALTAAASLPALGLTWLLFRGSEDLRGALITMGVLLTILTAGLRALAPIMPDRMFAEMPASAVPDDAVLRDEAGSGGGFCLSSPCAWGVRWYEARGSDADVEKAVRDGFAAGGWKIRNRGRIGDFEAINPDRTIEAAVDVGVESAPRRFEAGSTEPLPRRDGATIVEISLSSRRR